MRRYVCLYFVYFLVVYLEFADSQSFVDDNCTLQGTQKPGVCKLLRKCLSAIQAVERSRAYPQLCGFEENEPIVCCPTDGAGLATSVLPTPTPTPILTTPKLITKPVIKQTPKPTAPTIRAKNPVFLKVGDKANQKCKEYGQFIYVEEQPPINIPGVKPYVRTECGITEVPLIVGGEDAKPKEFPHMALIGFQGADNEKKWLCGGSLISNEYVLTAAHCLYSKEFGGDPKYVLLGDLDLNRDDEDAEPQEFGIRNMFKHPKHKPPSRYNDIALIQMDGKANLNPYVRPICLNTGTELTTTHAIATGWGKIGFSSDVSSKLQKVTLEYYSASECNVSYRSNIGVRLQTGIVPDTQICAGSHDKKRDACLGDSGGPLQIYNSDEVNCTYKLIGVISFGQFCGVNIPGVYTLVSAYIEWIEKQVWP